MIGVVMIKKNYLYIFLKQGLGFLAGLKNLYLPIRICDM
ncbi:Uncharacterised protein [Klebsiella michiganensis]|nr:Uncharacterised protein [Klebsiella michiganensis]